MSARKQHPFVIQARDHALSVLPLPRGTVTEKRPLQTALDIMGINDCDRRLGDCRERNWCWVTVAELCVATGD